VPSCKQQLRPPTADIVVLTERMSDDQSRCLHHCARCFATSNCGVQLLGLRMGLITLMCMIQCFVSGQQCTHHPGSMGPLPTEALIF
jgi:hypothetical protein